MNELMIVIGLVWVVLIVFVIGLNVLVWFSGKENNYRVDK